MRGSTTKMRTKKAYIKKVCKKMQLYKSPLACILSITKVKDMSNMHTHSLVFHLGL